MTDKLTCKQCREEKTVDDFYKANRGTTRFTECKDCNRARARKWAKDKRASDPAYANRARLKSVFNITPERYDDILAAQGGGCAICGDLPGERAARKLHVDHDRACCEGNRSCGKCVRGILCHHCNVALGSMQDDPKRLLAAADYLLRQKNVLGAPQ